MINSFYFRLILFALLGLGISSAWGHGAERGLVLLLPTDFYVAGGTIAVAASFILLAFVPVSAFSRVFGVSGRSRRIASLPRAGISLVSLLALISLIVVGFYGSRDPLSNPLPLTVWTVFWVALPLIQCVTGSLWAWLNPWSGVVSLLAHMGINSGTRFRLPERIGYLPAILQFTAFAWFELVYIAPEDPEHLALAVLGYWLFNFVAIMLFGERDWFERGEPFAVFFRFIGLMSPMRLEGDKREGGRFRWVVPGSRLAAAKSLSFSGVLFVLLTLSTVSFDGLSCTFFWLGNVGINPLAFPGRSAVTGINSVGLLGTFAGLVCLYYLAVLVGYVLSSRSADWQALAGRMVYSIIPVSLVFHFAHYLTVLMTNLQYFAVSVGDPLNKGWDLLGLGNYHVTTSFLSHIESVTVIWTMQTVVVAAGHVVGIVVAHGIALNLYSESRKAVLSQYGMAILMVAYTVFGLWLLSAVSIA